jgi:peptide/nickel transport system permease protein
VGRFIVRRLVGMVLVLFAISVMVFLIFNVIPNNDPAQQIGGKNADQQLIDQINKEWGFKESLPTQYTTMMKKIFTGDLVSYQNQRNVIDQIKKGIPITFSLCIGAAIIWMAFAIVFGYLSAVKAGQLTDRSLTILALIGISLPVFWLGEMAIYYLTSGQAFLHLKLFPSGGYVPLTEDPLQWFNHLLLPWITLAVLYIGFYSRLLRSNMLDVMDEDYVRTARAKGLPEREVRLKHVLRNSMIPIVTLFGLDFGAVIGGATILTETVYNLPGVGLYAGQAVASLDLPPLIAVTIFGAFFIVLLNTIVDILYAYLDPRIRLGTYAV